MTSPTLALLWYPGAQDAAVLGLRDLLETASRLQADRGLPGLEVRVLRTEEGLPEPEAPFAALVLPPCLGAAPPSDPEGDLKNWLRRRHAEGTLLCSVCAGAFLLAETGLLDGRSATTHWALKDTLAGAFPAVSVDTDRLLIDLGDLWTAGGLMAWVDLGLRLVGRFLGPGALQATARHFLVDPGGREQRFYAPFAPVLTHGDAAVLKVQRWLQAQADAPVGIPAMARLAGLGERTFLRRFQRATGLRPTEYVQALRVARARELLETTDLAVEAVAWEVGYGDAGAFRRIFLRIVGLSPGEYRRRFSPGCAPP